MHALHDGVGRTREVHAGVPEPTRTKIVALIQCHFCLVDQALCGPIAKAEPTQVEPGQVAGCARRISEARKLVRHQVCEQPLVCFDLRNGALLPLACLGEGGNVRVQPENAGACGDLWGKRFK